MRKKADIIISKNKNKHRFSMLTGEPVIKNGFIPSLLIKIKTDEGMSFIRAFGSFSHITLNNEYPLSDKMYNTIQMTEAHDIHISYVNL